MKWKGDHVTRAANRAQSAEAILALAVWRARRQAARGERITVRDPNPVLSKLARQASESAAILTDRALAMARAARYDDRLMGLARHQLDEAERAELWAERAHQTTK